MSAPVAVVEDLTVRFARPRRLTDLRPAPFTAVDGVSFELRPGAITGLVGQSGSGKSTVARAVLRLVPFEGRITVGDVAVHDLPLHPPRSVRRRVQAVFQDPLQALNPRHTVARIIGEPLRLHRMVERESVDARVDELLASVGLGTDLRDRTTRELSGGQRQRVAIARALATEPDLLVLDEALSALDVTSAARVASLLRAVLDDTTAMLFIGHDLAMVRQLCDDVLVMHAGQVVERGVAEQVCGDPQHDYTQRLIASIPDPTG